MSSLPVVTIIFNLNVAKVSHEERPAPQEAQRQGLHQHAQTQDQRRGQERTHQPLPPTRESQEPQARAWRQRPHGDPESPAQHRKRDPAGALPPAHQRDLPGAVRGALPLDQPVAEGAADQRGGLHGGSVRGLLPMLDALQASDAAGAGHAAGPQDKRHHGPRQPLISLFCSITENHILGSLRPLNWTEEQELFMILSMFLSLTLLASTAPFFSWMVGRKLLLRSSFLLCCSRFCSSRSILIISFCRNSMNLACSEFFFFSSGLRGRCLAQSAAICSCYNSHCFSDRMWLLFLFQNLNWLNSSMQCWMMGSCSLMRFSSLLLMLTLSTLFSMNLTMRLAYLTDRLSNIWMVCRLMVSSKTTYLISPLALQTRLPSSSQWKKKNSNLTPSFFMNSMQSCQFTLSLLPIFTSELYARMLSPYFTQMKPSRMKMSLSSFSRMRVMALMVMRVSARVLFTIRFLMFLAAAVAWISRSSFTASKKICELTFSENLVPFLKVSTVRMSLPTASPVVRVRLVSMQSPLRLVRSERSISACSTSSRSELSRQRCCLKISMKRRCELPSQMQEKAQPNTSWFSLMNSPYERDMNYSLPIFTRYRRASRFRPSQSFQKSRVPLMRLPSALISWMMSSSAILISLLMRVHLNR